MSFVSSRLRSNSYVHASSKRAHIAWTAELPWAASTAAADFHSKTSTKVPSAARMRYGGRSVTKPLLPQDRQVILQDVPKQPFFPFLRSIRRDDEDSHASTRTWIARRRLRDCGGRG